MKINVWCKTDVGRVRSHNEDCCYGQSGDRIALGIVCDGMGGANAGEVASRIATETFCQTLSQGGCSPEELMRLGLERANQEVYCYGWEHPECRGMGTTMVAALIIDDSSYILNVGDSRAYSIKETGIRQLTQDHSLVQELVRAGQITPEEAKTHPRRNIITRALGTERKIVGDLFIHRLEEGEVILLCSDGLSGDLSEEQLQQLTLMEPEEQCAQRLIDAANERGGRDNISAVCLKVSNTLER